MKALEPPDHLVGDPFYHVLETSIPTFSTDPLTRLLCWYLLMRAPRDTRHSDRVVVSNRALGELLNQRTRYLSGNQVARTLWIKFEKDTGIVLDLSDWSYKNSQARTVRPNWSDPVLDAAEAEKQRGLGVPVRYLLDGGKPSETKNRRQRQVRVQAARQWARWLPLPPAVEEVMNYLNGQTSHRFTKLRPAIAAMMAEIEQEVQNHTNLYHHEPLTSHQRIHLLCCLAAIHADPTPIYQPSSEGKTVRLYPVGFSLAGLKSEFRKRLTYEWVECDLKASQLAICVRLWEVAELESFLKKGENFWDYLIEHLGLLVIECNASPHLPIAEIKKQIKKRLKTQTYALLYGRSPQRVVLELHSRACWKQNDIGPKFLGLSLIQALLAGRTRRVAQIQTEGGLTDCFDRVLSWKPTFQSTPADPKKLDKSMRSLLTQEAQAMEMKIMMSAFELAAQYRGDSGFTITLFQHDGFCFVPHKRTDTERWCHKLREAIAQRGAELGVIASLEIIVPESTPDANSVLCGTVATSYQLDLAA